MSSAQTKDDELRQLRALLEELRRVDPTQRDQAATLPNDLLGDSIEHAFCLVR